MVLVSINAFAGPAPSAFMWDSPLDAHGLCYSRYAHVPSPLPAHAPTLGLTDAGCTHWYRLYTLRTLRRPTTLKPPPLPSVQHYEHPRVPATLWPLDPPRSQPRAKTHSQQFLTKPHVPHRSPVKRPCAPPIRERGTGRVWVYMVHRVQRVQLRPFGTTRTRFRVR